MIPVTYTSYGYGIEFPTELPSRPMVGDYIVNNSNEQFLVKEVGWRNTPNGVICEIRLEPYVYVEPDEDEYDWS